MVCLLLVCPFSVGRSWNDKSNNDNFRIISPFPHGPSHPTCCSFPNLSAVGMILTTQWSWQQSHGVAQLYPLQCKTTMRISQARLPPKWWASFVWSYTSVVFVWISLYFAAVSQVLFNSGDDDPLFEFEGVQAFRFGSKVRTWKSRATRGFILRESPVNDHPFRRSS